MKKLFKLALVAFAILIVAVVAFALGSGDTATPTTEPTTATDAKETKAKEEKPKAEEKVAKIGDTLKVGDVTYTVHERSKADNVGGEFGTNSQGEYLILDVTVKNEGKEALMVDSSLFTVLQDDITYESDGEASIYANENAEFFLTELNPNLEAKGKVVFDLPAEAHGEDLKLKVTTGFFGTESGEIALQ